MEKEKEIIVYYKFGENKDIDELFKINEGRSIIKSELLTQYLDMTKRGNDSWRNLKKAIEEFKNISLPSEIFQHFDKEIVYSIKKEEKKKQGFLSKIIN